MALGFVLMCECRDAAEPENSSTKMESHETLPRCTCTAERRPISAFSAAAWVHRCGVTMARKLNTKPPIRRNRPTKVALREMAKIRAILGLPKLPAPI